MTFRHTRPREDLRTPTRRLVQLIAATAVALAGTAIANAQTSWTQVGVLNCTLAPSVGGNSGWRAAIRPVSLGPWRTIPAS